MAAFEELIYKYDRQVLAVAASFKNNEDDAKDIYQEVFIRVYKNIGSFQYKSQFSTWLFRIATNVCLTHRMRQKRHESEISSVPSSDPESGETEDIYNTIADCSSEADGELNKQERLKYIRLAMRRLPEKQRMVFTLKHLQGYKIKEIAEMLGSSEGTVKKYLFTAVHKLREELKDFKND
jgi:RNA polymerase sigma-70 factor (ECF subfamily)